MNNFSPPRKHLRGLIVFFVVLSIAISARVGTAFANLQGPEPTLIIEAPDFVEVGQWIEVQLIVDNAHDLAGYEAQLLFDTSAAHFSGLHQRDSDLKKFGRDVIPLEVPELLDGIAFGLASCPYLDCVGRTGNPQPQGANGRVRLATVLVGTDQEGLLELSFEHLKFVDSSANLIPVQIPEPRIYVQVGANTGTSFAAPASGWTWSSSPPTLGNLDITGDGLVNYSDAIEVAFEWKIGRELGQPCGPSNDLSRDVNGDSCIDVVDIQLILANTTGTRSRAGPSAPVLATGSKSGAAAPLAAALTFVVNSTSDAVDSNIGDGNCASISGCTLRAAIEEANRHAGPDIIHFNIPGSGVKTIQLNSRLPSLWDGSGGTTIDGYSQPSAQANTHNIVSNASIMIQIRGNGRGAFDAMLIQSAGNRIQGLSIFNARRGIWIYGSGAKSNFIAGNFLGTNAVGTFGHTGHTLHAEGISIDSGPSSNHIGGMSPAERNVISGNARHGIGFYGDTTDNNEVYNNLIGLNPSGTARLQNFRHGIDFNSGPSSNIVGGTASGQRNILSGNGEDQNAAFVAGIEISHDPLTDKNQVIGNCIGTDPTCNSAPAWALNRHYGVRLEDGVNENTVAYNIIGNAPFGGISVYGNGVTLNQIHDNRIGVSLNNTAIPNVRSGIRIEAGSQTNTIGPNNIIANNSIGVEIIGNNTDKQTITQNSIYNNSKLGIDLGTSISGVTPNDGGDGDAGSNQELNMPVLTGATTTSVTGTACAESVVPKPCTVQIFIAQRVTSDNGSGNYGQGTTFVGSGTSNTNGSFTIAVSGVSAGQYLTATATDADGNTSEFSQNIQATGSGTSPTPTPTSQTPTPTTQPGGTTYASDTFTRTITNGWGSADIGGSYTLSGTSSNYGVDGSAGTITVPAAGNVREVILQNVSAQDLDFTFRVKTDKVSAGSNQAVILLARRVSSNTVYRCQIRIPSNNTVYLRAIRVVNDSQTPLGTDVLVSGLAHTANSYIWMRGQVVGTNPTTIRLKVWANGQSEPANWQYTVTDSASALQTTGAVGLHAFLSSGVTNAPVIFTFDDFLVRVP